MLSLFRNVDASRCIRVAPAFGRSVPQAQLQKESKVEEAHLMPDHAHMLLSIPPTYAVSHVVGFIKGKSAIHMAGVMGSAGAISSGNASGRGLFANTVGRDEERSAPMSAIKKEDQ
jgi:putative transposase